MRHVVGISCGGVDDNFCLRRYYLQALNRVGLAGVILPPPALPKAELQKQAAALAERLDGLLLSGGGDFRPQLWGEYPHLPPEKLFELEQLVCREDWEMALLAAFRRRQRPVLGICRGMQLLNVAFGGSLWQDLGERPDSAEHYQAAPPAEVSHRARCRGVLAEWLGAEEVAVNSLHHQAVRQIGRGLRALALAEDGVVEAVGKTDGGFCLGVQWHPERLQNQPGIWQAFAAAILKK